MKISLSNVAIVENAQIEIDGITVAAGLNGSGKTTVGKAIYASINAYKDLPKRILRARENSIYSAVSGILEKNAVFPRSGNYYSTAYSFIDSFPFYDFLDKEKSECAEILEKYVANWAVDKESIEKEDMEEIFSSVLDVVTRKDEAYTKFLVESLFTGIFSKQINCLKNEKPARIVACFDDMELYSAFLNNELIENVNNIEFAQKAIYIESFHVLDLFKNNRIYSRTIRGITAASRDLFQYLRTPDEDVEQSFEDYENSKELKRIIEIIITRVTHGKLNVDSNGNIDFYDNRTNHTVNISNLSAGIKVFVILQSLLENGNLNRGDILLIDEPEVNLHPEWQVAFAEILVLLQKEVGINVYVNTHSPYFTRAIEVKMAENGIHDKGRFYLLREQKNGLYKCEDVTSCPEKIYSMLYKPLDSL